MFFALFDVKWVHCFGGRVQGSPKAESKKGTWYIFVRPEGMTRFFAKKRTTATLISHTESFP